MHDLIAITPLGGTTPRVDQFEGLDISERPDWALASVAARRQSGTAFAKAAKDALGTALPGPGSMATGPELTAFWTGPDQWMIEAPHESHEDLAARLKSALGDTASVVEQNDAWVRFDLTGNGTIAVFERLCNLDLVRMESGTASRTSIDHLGCFVLCREAGMEFSVIGPRSSAGSLHHALCTAAASALG